MEMVQEKINSLIKLQAIDAEIYGLKEEKSAKPAQKQALQEAFAEKERALNQKAENLKSLQLKRKEREMDMEAKEKDIQKYQTQLLQVKTNKEYLSLQKEIAGLKADNSVLEDDILALMEEADKLKAQISGEKEALAGEEESLKQEIGRIDQEIKDIDGKISSLEKEREQACANIEKALLGQYERILKAKQGLALVPLVDESCGGCHRVLPPQIVSELRMKDKIITCEFCSRLLYLPE